MRAMQVMFVGIAMTVWFYLTGGEHEDRCDHVQNVGAELE